jgi:hypothetical protein
MTPQRPREAAPPVIACALRFGRRLRARERLGIRGAGRSECDRDVDLGGIDLRRIEQRLRERPIERIASELGTDDVASATSTLFFRASPARASPARLWSRSSLMAFRGRR